MSTVACQNCGASVDTSTPVVWQGTPYVRCPVCRSWNPLPSGEQLPDAMQPDPDPTQ